MGRTQFHYVKFLGHKKIPITNKLKLELEYREIVRYTIPNVVIQRREFSMVITQA